MGSKMIVSPGLRFAGNDSEEFRDNRHIISLEEMIQSVQNPAYDATAFCGVKFRIRHSSTLLVMSETVCEDCLAKSHATLVDA